MPDTLMAINSTYPLNAEKCKAKRDTITFFGAVHNANGAHPDPKKVDCYPQDVSTR